MDNYGTMAVPVSPVAPESQEIEQARNVFQRMADAVVAASSLRGEVEELRTAVATLRNEIDFIRTRNRELDEQVTEVRRQRDQAVSELADLKTTVLSDAQSITTLQRDNEALNNAVERQRQEIADLKRQRDDAAYSHMEAEDQLKKLTPLIESLSNVLPKPSQPVQPVQSTSWETPPAVPFFDNPRHDPMHRDYDPYAR